VSPQLIALAAGFYTASGYSEPKVRIPVIPATDSGGSRPPVPEQGGRV